MALLQSGMQAGGGHTPQSVEQVEQVSLPLHTPSPHVEPIFTVTDLGPVEAHHETVLGVESFTHERVKTVFTETRIVSLPFTSLSPLQPFVAEHFPKLGLIFVVDQLRVTLPA